MLKILHELGEVGQSGVSVDADATQMIRITRDVGSAEVGFLVAPEGAARFAALKALPAGGESNNARRAHRHFEHWLRDHEDLDCYQQ